MKKILKLKIFTNKVNGQKICFLSKNKIKSGAAKVIKIKEYEFEE